MTRLPRLPSVLDDPDVQPLLRRKPMSQEPSAPAPDANDNPPCGPVYPPTSIEPGSDETPDEPPLPVDGDAEDLDPDFDSVEDEWCEDEDDEDADRELDDTFTLEDE